MVRKYKLCCNVFLLCFKMYCSIRNAYYINCFRMFVFSTLMLLNDWACCYNSIKSCL